MIFPVGTILLGRLLINRRNRIKSEQLQQESEQRFQRAMNASQDGVYDWDLKTKDIYYSPGWKRMLGYEPDELPNDFSIWEELTHPDDVKASWTIINEVIEGKRDRFEIESRMKHKNGHWVDILSRSNLYKDDLNGKVRVVGTHVDISEIKKVERKLKEREEEHGAILKTAMDGFCILDTAGRFLEVNETYCEMSGYAEEELLRMDISSVEDVEEPADTAAHMQKVLAEGQDRFESRHRRKDGTVFDVEVSVQNRPLDEPQCVVFIRDITAHRKAEQDYQTLFREMLDGFALHEIILDAAGTPVDYRFLAVNPAFERMTSLKAVDIVGRTVIEALPSTERHWIKTYGKVALTGEPAHFESHSAEVGKYFEVTSFRPVPGQFACIFQDITERKKAEAEREKLQTQLTQAQKMESIGNLAGGIAHDFNNILFPIVGMSELLLEDLPPGSGERENVKEIFKAGKRGSDLVKQILAFSRESEHKMMPTRIQNILKEVIKLSRSTIPTYIEIEQDIQQNCGMVMADPSQIHQIGMNIITNAYHAVEDTGGKIFIKLNQTVLDTNKLLQTDLKQGDYAVLSISDTGHGMSKELSGKIFDPYFTTKKQDKGTGLGLAVVYGIVKAHGGDIKVHSEIGKGSTFDIYFPVMEKTDRTESFIEVEAYHGGNERILLVDDEESIAKLEKRMLERMGYKVTSRLHSGEALEKFKSSPSLFDLVITDMSMPNIPGDELARKIKSIRSDVPIIICTGFSERIHENNFEQMGIDGLLMKPVVKSELAKTVRKVLEKAQGKI
ncbi:PAS domain-containing hybrid sensor histidine kinase/response regulator [Desulfobacter hydrogenophilus]|uniref:PAS domain-containing hybrid sensor histidine kinase/response regulator n=1 Tax=Desulfobacter hydrogenophilus TaxID=2291 RepID=UPI0013D8392B|nr:PAS domain S-box protein [Desulfobacter hydrogenophilus]